MRIKLSVVWGLWLGLATVITTQILTWVGLGLSGYFIWITYILVIIFISLALKRLKKTRNDSLDLVTAFVSVFIIILVARLIFQSYMYIYTQFIHPGWVSEVVENWTGTMRDSGMEEDAIADNIQQFKKSYEPIHMFTTALLGYAVPQFILGWVIGLFFVFRK